MPRQDGRPAALKIDDITIDPRLEVRAEGTDFDHVDTLVAVFKARKGKMPPRVKIRVVEDPPGHPKGTYSFAIDGKHTLEAARQAGKRVVGCVTKRTSWEQAVTDAAMSNQGPRALPMKNRDRERAVKMLFTVHGDGCDEPWSDAMIAKSIGVSAEYVRQRRPKDSLPTVGSQRKGLDGRKQAPKKPEREPDPDADHKARKLHIGSLKVADYIQAAFNRAGLTTLGGLADLLAQDGLQDVKAGDRQDLIDELKAQGVHPLKSAKPPKVYDDPEPQKPGDPLFDWRKFDTHYGVIARGPDAVARAYPNPDVKLRADGITRLLTEVRSAWDELRAIVTQSQEEEAK